MGVDKVGTWMSPWIGWESRIRVGDGGFPIDGA